MSENEIAKIVVDSALRIHKVLGPGLLESVYEELLAHDLVKRELQVERQKSFGLRMMKSNWILASRQIL